MYIVRDLHYHMIDRLIDSFSKNRLNLFPNKWFLSIDIMSFYLLHEELSLSC